MKTFAFPKHHRLLKPRDFSGVFDNVQVRVPHRYFLILATPNDLGVARVGFVFSKKNLKLAVQRNRVKRIIRESFRLQTRLPAMDIVILSRKGLAQVDNGELHPMISELWQRLKRKSRQPETSIKPQSDPVPGAS